MLHTAGLTLVRLSTWIDCLGRGAWKKGSFQAQVASCAKISLAFDVNLFPSNSNLETNLHFVTWYFFFPCQSRDGVFFHYYSTSRTRSTEPLVLGREQLLLADVASSRFTSIGCRGIHELNENLDDAASANKWL